MHSRASHSEPRNQEGDSMKTYLPIGSAGQADTQQWPAAPGGAGLPERTISSTDLFAGRREIGIEHHGSHYRLKITRQGKLILNK